MRCRSGSDDFESHEFDNGSYRFGLIKAVFLKLQSGHSTQNIAS